MYMIKDRQKSNEDDDIQSRMQRYREMHGLNNYIHNILFHGHK